MRPVRLYQSTQHKGCERLAASQNAILGASPTAIVVLAAQQELLQLRRQFRWAWRADDVTLSRRHRQRRQPVKQYSSIDWEVHCYLVTAAIRFSILTSRSVVKT